MHARILLHGLAALAMGLAIHDLTGSLPAGIAAATLPLVIGLTRLMPFAATALPVAALAWALAARHLPPPDAGEAAKAAAPRLLAEMRR